MNRYKDAFSQYGSCIHFNTDDDQDDRIHVNKLAAMACQAAIHGGEHSQEILDLANISHETQFNASCYYAALGQHEEALGLIQTAIEWTRNELQDIGADEKEIKHELRSYILHRARLLAKLNKLAEAQADLAETVSDDNALELAKINALIWSNSIAIDDDISQLLQKNKLSFTQKPYALLTIAQQLWLKDAKNNAIKVANILRKLVKINMTKPIATAFLLVVLLEMNRVNEIKRRSKSCNMMKSAWRAHCYLESKSIDMRQCPPGLLGALYSMRPNNLKDNKKKNILRALADKSDTNYHRGTLAQQQ